MDQDLPPPNLGEMPDLSELTSDELEDFGQRLQADIRVDEAMLAYSKAMLDRLTLEQALRRKKEN